MSEKLKLPPTLARRLVDWQRLHGRQHLPWQHTRDPYRVWLSEIMLQQTQVSTVLDYYPRFVQRFADVRSLAQASQDEVLALWSGLGYYSRARNLHRCAQEVVQRFDGQFPNTAQALQTLPGIGRSTAAAIAAFCFDERAAILDGNVKRVLSRALGYGADLAIAAHERTLWDMAQQLLPAQNRDMPAYTQALMDVGATLCLPRSTQCPACPLQGLCVAAGEGDTLAYPVKSRKLKRSSMSLYVLWAVNAQGAVWLHKRPNQGIWAGLYSMPVFDSEAAVRAACPAAAVQWLAPFKHVLTHRDLHLHPVRVLWPEPQASAQPIAAQDGANPAGSGAWWAADQWPALGLPAPIRRLLNDGPG